MRRSLLIHKSIIYFAVLIMAISSGCSTTIATSTPQKLQLVNGELEACSLLSAAEVESVSGIHVTGKIGSIYKPATCEYLSSHNDEQILVNYAITDATRKRLEKVTLIKSDSAVDWYEIVKQEDLSLSYKLPESMKVEDLDNLGDQAYVVIEADNLIKIQVLKNNIVYWFISYTNRGTDRIGYDALLKLAKLASQRMP